MCYALYVRLWYETFTDVYPGELKVCTGGVCLYNRHTNQCLRRLVEMQPLGRDRDLGGHCSLHNHEEIKWHNILYITVLYMHKGLSGTETQVPLSISSASRRERIDRCTPVQ